jgi:hypothetical protein
MGMDMTTPDTTMVKVAKMQNILTFLTEGDEDESTVILLHLLTKLCAPELDSTKMIKSLDEIRELKTYLKERKGVEWV